MPDFFFFKDHRSQPLVVIGLDDTSRNASQVGALQSLSGIARKRVASMTSRLVPKQQANHQESAVLAGNDLLV